MGPRTILTGRKIDYKRHCRLAYGEYVQTHEEGDNTLKARTTGAIALRPTGNAQGTYYFYNLKTGRRIARTRWTKIPIPNEVIERVQTMANAQNNPDGWELTLGAEELPLDDELFIDDDYEDDYDSLIKRYVALKKSSKT